MTTASGHSAAYISDNHTMTGPASSPLRRILRAPFTRRTWAELAYSIASALLDVGALVFIVPMLVNGALWAASAPGVRKLGAADRFLAYALLGENVPPPPPIRPNPRVQVRTPDAERLAALAEAEGAKVQRNGSRVRIVGLPGSRAPGPPGHRVTGSPGHRVTGLTAQEHIAIEALRPENKFGWWRGAVYDRAAWRTRAYFGLKLPLGGIGLLVAACFEFAGLFYLTYPIWWALARTPWLPGAPVATLAGSFLFLPLGAALLLVSPWLMHAVTEVDMVLIRGLLGPGSPDSAALAERVRDLEQTRAHAVDDSAARLRNIERDLHDGAQALGPLRRAIRRSVHPGPRDRPRPVRFPVAAPVRLTAGRPNSESRRGLVRR
jgi:hypothetical protein